MQYYVWPSFEFLSVLSYAIVGIGNRDSENPFLKAQRMVSCRLRRGYYQWHIEGVYKFIVLY